VSSIQSPEKGARSRHGSADMIAVPPLSTRPGRDQSDLTATPEGVQLPPNATAEMDRAVERLRLVTDQIKAGRARTSEIVKCVQPCAPDPIANWHRKRASQRDLFSKSAGPKPAIRLSPGRPMSGTRDSNPLRTQSGPPASTMNISRSKGDDCQSLSSWTAILPPIGLVLTTISDVATHHRGSLNNFSGMR
jgi:hypothetical protein